MKKNHFMLAMGITLSSITTNNSNAQLLAANIGKNIEGNEVKAEPTTVLSAKEEARAAKATAKLTKANLRAFKGFQYEFKDGPDVKWMNEKEVISATFKRDDIQSYIVFDKKGRWIRNMHVYQEDKMPRDIRSQVKRSQFYDYKITSVQDIKEGDLHFYIVHLENDKNYKQVCVYDGQINVLKEFEKQAL